MAFDIEGARKAGYSDGEIASYLGSQSGFDVDGALKSGYEPGEIVSFLSEQQPKSAFEKVRESVTSAAGKVADEAGQLRDEFFSGVDNVVAGVKTLNAGIQMRRLQETEADAKRLEERGQPLYASQMRGEAQSLQERVPRTVGEAAQAQETSQRGSQMATRPQLAKFLAEKTWGGAWEAFKEAPYDVIAGLTATSLPAALPGIAAASAMGVGAGALVMGTNSAAVEAGSSLGEFARESGVDVTDAKALQAFYSDPKTLAAGMTYAGKRAGIIGALDAASGGIAGKTLAGPIKGRVARQAVNMPAQMGVQAGLGAAGEAGGQIATKGRIDDPAQVLGEAFGEMGGAPVEVVAFSKEARDALRPKATASDVLNAPDVDTAIQTAQEALSAPIAEAGRAWQAIAPTQPAGDLSSLRAASVAGQTWQDIAPTDPLVDLSAQRENEQRQSEQAGAAASRAADQRIAEVGQAWQNLGITDPADDLQRQRTWGQPDARNPVAAAPDLSGGVDGRGADIGGSEPAGGLGDSGPGAARVAAASGGAAVPVEPAGGQPAAVVAPPVSTPPAAEVPAQGKAVAPSVAPSGYVRNPSGTVTVTGEPQAVRKLLADSGIPSIPGKGGVLVGKSHADKAEKLAHGLAGQRPDQIRAGPDPHRPGRCRRCHWE